MLLAGCYNGGIQLYDTLGNDLWQKTIISEKVKDINAIEKLADNIYFIGTIGRGWFTLNLVLKKLCPFELEALAKNEINSYETNFSNNIQRINDSSFFIATASNVLNCCFKNKHLASVSPLLPANSAKTDAINCFLYTSNHTLWAGTSTGILYKIYDHNNNDTFYIPDNFLIRNIAEDSLHNIWIGTDKGLYVYNIYGKLVKTINVQTGLLNDCIYALLPVGKQSAVLCKQQPGIILCFA